MKPRISLRVNGTRVGDAARPAESNPVPRPTLGGRRLGMLRVNAAALVRDYRDELGPDDDGAAS